MFSSFNLWFQDRLKGPQDVKHACALEIRFPAKVGRGAAQVCLIFVGPAHHLVVARMAAAPLTWSAPRLVPSPVPIPPLGSGPSIFSPGATRSGLRRPSPVGPRATCPDAIALLAHRRRARCIGSNLMWRRQAQVRAVDEPENRPAIEIADEL